MPPSMLMLIILLCWASTAHAVTYYVNKSGTNSHTCAQAQQPSGARQSINAALGCLRSGDRLVIGGGTYAELLTDVPIDGVTPVPDNVTLEAASQARVVLRPGAREFPGGGGVITLSERARGITMRGLNVDAADQHTHGVMLDGTHLRFLDAEVTSARSQGVASFKGSDTVMRGLHVHHNGRAGRMAHGFYVCGTNKIVEYNIVHDNADYGIQVSCETGGIRNALVRHNVVYNQSGRCYHVQGNGNKVYNNLAMQCFVGIGVRGGDTQVVHNTIIGGYPGTNGIGILTHSGGSVQIANNVILDMAGGAILGDGVTPNASHNACDRSQVGCLVVETGSRLVRNAGSRDLHLMPGSKAIGAARADVARMAPTDFDGNPRPMDGSPDIGAYEFGGTTRPMPTPGSGGPDLPPPGPPPTILPPPRQVRPVTTGTMLPPLPDTTPPPVAIVPTPPPAPPRVLA